MNYENYADELIVWEKEERLKKQKIKELQNKKKWEDILYFRLSKEKQKKLEQ